MHQPVELELESPTGIIEWFSPHYRNNRVHTDLEAHDRPAATLLIVGGMFRGIACAMEEDRDYGVQDFSGDAALS